MEIEVQVTKTIEVEVDVTVTPVDGRLPGPPGPRYRSLFSDDLVLERIDDRDSGNGLPHSRETGLQARIQDSLDVGLRQPNRHSDQPADPGVRLLTAQSIKDKRIDPWQEEPSLALSGFEVCRAAKKPLTPVDACMRERFECPLNELRICDALAWLSECRLHVAAEDSLGKVTRHAALPIRALHASVRCGDGRV